MTTFAREWNAALTLVVLAATILFATDHVLAGAAAVTFGARGHRCEMDSDAAAEPQLLRTEQGCPLKRAICGEV